MAAYEVKIQFPDSLSGRSNVIKKVVVPALNAAHAKEVAEGVYSGCIASGTPKRV